MEPNQQNVGGVQFDSEQLAPAVQRPRRTSFMVRLVIKTSGGAIKTEQGANILLISIAVLCLAATAFLWLGGGSATALPPTPEDTPL